MRQSAATTFLSALPVFLFVSAILFSFRSAVRLGTLNLTALLDHDPAVRSLLTRLSSSPSSSDARLPDYYTRHPRHPLRHHRRSPFLHLTRLRTLDDDFFSDADYTVDYGPQRQRLMRNSTSFFTPSRRLHLDRTLGEHKFRVPDRSDSPVLFFLHENATGDGGKYEDRDRTIKFKIFGQGFDLNREVAALLIYLVSLLSAAHSSAILGFLLSYTCALGVVFYVVANSFLGKQCSFFYAVYSGSRLGIRRLSASMFLRWALRDTLTQFLCIWFFSDVKDQRSLFKVFVMVKILPFSLTASPPLIFSVPDDVNLPEFFIAWIAIDMAIGILLAVDCWVAVMAWHERRTVREVVKEGCHLVSKGMSQAVFIRCLQTVLCGSIGRWVLLLVGGRLCASVVQSVAEVYFMVVWLMFYFAARCKEGGPDGRRILWRDLEDCINSLR